MPDALLGSLCGYTLIEEMISRNRLLLRMYSLPRKTVRFLGFQIPITSDNSRKDSRPAESQLLPLSRVSGSFLKNLLDHEDGWHVELGLALSKCCSNSFFARLGFPESLDFGKINPLAFDRSEGSATLPMELKF